MKSFVTTFSLLLLASASAMAQSAIRPNTIFDKLAKEELGKGTVSIHQSDDIRAMVGAHKYGENVEQNGNEIFPDVPTYVTYNAPFWKLRVGDFRSHEEAYQMMRQLMGAFPGFAKEMYIVKEEVKIPLY